MGEVGLMRPIPLFGIGNTGKSVNVSSQERTNLYVEVKQDDEGKHILAIYSTLGLVDFVYFGADPLRGVYQLGHLIYAVHKNSLYSVSANGTTALLGTLSSTEGRVYFSDNGTQLMIVDGSYGYIWNTNTLAFAQIADVDFPGGSIVTFLNGRFLVNKPTSGQIFFSGLYDGTSWDALDYFTAESDPDNVVAIISENGQLVIYGEKTTEFWSDSGATDLPYARVGSSAIEWGLAARETLCKYMDSLAFLRKNRLGAVQVCVQSGYQSVPISTPEIEYQFSTYGNVSNATAFAYMYAGHPFYQINFTEASWLYDGQSKSWSKLSSGETRHKADKFIQLNESQYVCDYSTGNLYRLSDTTYTDDGEPIIRELVTRHQTNGNEVTFSSVWLEFEPGVGLQNGQGSDPQVMMQYSKDGGKTWSSEIWRDIGQVGKYRTRALWNRLGSARDWVFKFRISDPVKVSIVAAWGEAS